jgi:hypothetical protein
MVMSLRIESGKFFGFFVELLLKLDNGKFESVLVEKFFEFSSRLNEILTRFSSSFENVFETIVKLLEKNPENSRTFDGQNCRESSFPHYD